MLLRHAMWYMPCFCSMLSSHLLPMLHAYDVLFKSSCCLPFAMITRFCLRDMLYPYWHILLFVLWVELCTGRLLLFVTLCYSCAIDLDVCVWNVFVQGKLMKYVSHTIFTISNIVVIATILIVYFTSNNYMTVVLSIVVIYIDFS